MTPHSHPRRTRAISGPDCFGRPTRPNGVGFNRGTPVFAANGNTRRLPFVTDCLFKPRRGVVPCVGALAGGGEA
jgi:hypothetical protein